MIPNAALPHPSRALRWRQFALAAFVLVACGDSAREAGVPAGASQAANLEAPSVPWPAELSGYDEELVQALERVAETVRAQPSSADNWTQLGLLYQAHSLHELARDCYAQSVALDGSAAKVWYWLAATLVRVGDEGGALTAFGKVHELAPDYAPALRRAARYLLDVGQPLQAQLLFEQALALDGNDKSSRLGLIQVQLDLGDAAAALAALDAISKVGPGLAGLSHRLRGQALARLGRLEEAESELALGVGARARGGDPWMRETDAVRVGGIDLGPTASMLRADRMIKSGRVSNALRLLHSLSERVPDDPRIFQMLGTEYAKQKNWKPAISAWESAVALLPENVRLRLALGVTLWEAHDIDAAVAEMEVAMKLDATLIDPYVLENEILLQVGRFEEVRACFQRALGLGHKSAELFISGGKACIELGFADEALRNFELALELDGAAVDAWAGKALALINLGRSEDARQAVEKLTELESAHPLLGALREGLEQIKEEDR